MVSVATHRSSSTIAGQSRAQTPPAGPSPDRPSFEADASTVLGELRDAFAALLAAAPSPTSSCTEVESALGIDAMLAWQVLRIARVTDPFEGGIKVPSRISLNKLIKAAVRRRIPEGITDRVLRAFGEYERLVAEHAGTRAEFEMMVSAYSPEAREKAEFAGKQAAFKGISQVKGVMAEADFTFMFWVPAADGFSVDSVIVEGHLGIRRVWPGAPILFSEGNLGRASVLKKLANTLHTLDGDPIQSEQKTFIREFSSSPLPQFRQHTTDVLTYHSVTSQDVGLRSAIDLVRGTLRQGSKFRYRQQSGHYSGLIEVLEFPAKRLTVDLFLHEDVYAGVSPELAIYDTASDGMVTKFNDPAREHDRLQLHETIRHLGTGLGQAKLSHIPRYLEMLQYVCAKRGLNPAEFRGYRLDVQYPVYGAEYMMAFRLPDPPEGKGGAGGEKAQS